MTYPQQGEWVPRALWGAPLEGSKPVRYVYVDEAGTSANEPVSVVAGVIVHPDTQWRVVEAEINRLFDQFVPDQFRKGFVFHAVDVFGGGKLRDVWDKASRWELLDAMVLTPRRFRLPIAYGLVRRQALAPDFAKEAKLSLASLDHAIAFFGCVAYADKYLRLHTGPDEVATLVVEDVPEMRKVLGGIPEMLRADTYTLKPEHIRQDVTDITPEKAAQGDDLKVTKIVDTPHFVVKKGAPLLQLADACAFTIRRWISRQSRGDDLMQILKGNLPVLEDFSGPSSFGFWGI